MSRIEQYNATGEVVRSCEREFTLDMHAIATDAAPRPVSENWTSGFPGCEWMTSINPDEGEMSEAEFERSLFEGVPHAIGERRVREYRQKVEEQKHLQRATKRR